MELLWPRRTGARLVAVGHGCRLVAVGHGCRLVAVGHGGRLVAVGHGCRLGLGIKISKVPTLKHLWEYKVSPQGD